MRTNPNYGQSFTAWRGAITPLWQQYTHHDFVERLADGRLPRAAFLHYLTQDYLFLVHFARAWSLAVTKAETLDEMKSCARTVDAIINYELANHVETCAGYGISETALFSAEEEIENLAYTRYVLDAGHHGDFLDMMAALAPCCFGYGEIGQRLVRTAANDTPYRGWIDTYADAGYQDVMVDIGTMIDGAVGHRLGARPQDTPRWAQLGNRFRTATRLEIAFWAMAMR